MDGDFCAGPGWQLDAAAAVPALAGVPPAILDSLFAPLTTLRGVGPDLAGRISRATGGKRVLDLLFHLPDAFIDRRNRVCLGEAPLGVVVTVEAEVGSIEKPQTPRQPTRVVIRDATGFARLIYFRAFPAAKFPVGRRILVSGKFTEGWNSVREMSNPPHVTAAERPEDLPAIEPVWPLVDGLHPNQLRRALAGALADLPSLPEWHDTALLAREGWPDFSTALRALHAPTEPSGPAPRLRLAYDELLADQLAVALVRKRERGRPGRALIGNSALRDEALRRFGHRLTLGQSLALAEIDADLAASARMVRLLQGDVGSGKTIVALLAMLRAVEAGAQAALMAPTEVLAQQHARTLQSLAPVAVGLLTGSIKGVARAQVLGGLVDGSLPMVVGTHALFQEAVTFRDLGLAVIDEQHRFGVDQRLLLGAKGPSADVLVMTATPIPRTLLLTQFGEMSVSRLTDKPAGRQPIRTTIHPLAAFGDVCNAMARALGGGARAYWVCPLVAESEVADLAAAEARFAQLRLRFGETVRLAHGRQDTAVRDAALADFAAGCARLLVATTVIEVGVDVPDATVIVIEHAERFGLAQLHQLRGRVGRGGQPSFCLLLHDEPLPETGRRRLALLRDTEDGFRIADEDFRIRGGGDLLGTRQAGARGFRLADPTGHETLLDMAADDAELLLQKDPQLESPRGRAARLLLWLFGRVDAMKTRHSG